MTRANETLASLTSEVREPLRVIDARLKTPPTPNGYERMALSFAAIGGAVERAEALCWKLKTAFLEDDLPVDLDALRALARELEIDVAPWHTQRYLKTLIMDFYREKGFIP